MQKVILCQGLPGSGKTTWAKQFCLDNPEYVRVSKDDIRIYLGNPLWTREFEDDVLKIEQLMVKTILKSGRSVVIDDSNFNKNHQNYWKILAVVIGFELSYQIFDTPLEECIARDKQRTEPVGESAIRFMHKTYLE